MTGNTAFSRQGHHSKGSKRLVFHIISWGKLSPVSYSRSMRGSRLHITFTQHRFQDFQCRYFFQVGMNLSIELRLGMPHTLVESTDTQKSLCSCVWKVVPLYTIIHYKTWIRSKIGKHVNYCTFYKNVLLIFGQIFWRKSVLKKGNDYPLPLWRPIKAKVFASLTVLSTCLQCFNAEPLPGGEMCDAVSQNDFRGAAQA